MSSVLIGDYSGSVSGGNWAPAYIAAKNAIIGTGGAIILDEQETTVTSLATMYPATVAPMPIAILGEYSIIKIGSGSGTNAFQFQNTACVFRDVILRPVDFTAATIDCAAAIWANGAGPVKFENVSVSAIRASDAVFRVSSAERVVMDTVEFGGCAGGNGVLNVTNGASMDINNCSWWDFTTFGTTGVVGKIQNSGNCITGVAHTTPLNGATYFARADIRNSLFDEGYNKHIDLDGYHRVTIENCGFNSPITSSGYGIHLKNCAYAVIKYCNFGFVNSTAAGYDRPFIKLEDCGEVVIIGMTNESSEANANPRIEADTATSVTIKHSPGITLTRV